ncbi:MAG: nitroreductase/quinone reductase family protein [Candidatus Acidiferrales bacterium]
MPKREGLKERLAPPGAGLAQLRQIEISVIGRRSGRRLSMPVWFVLEGNWLYLLPVRGSDTQWYKNLLRKPRIRISARGHKAEFRATPITRRAGVAAVIRKFGRKYKARIVRQLYFKFDVAVRVNLG